MLPRLGLVLALGVTAGCGRHKEAAASTPGAPAPGAAPAEAAAPAAPVEPPLSYELRLGKQVFQHYCLTCHGETGAGDGFNAFNVEPHPRDLGDPALQKAKTDADLKDTVRRGGVGVGLSPMMPPWGKTLTPDQIDQVVGYLRTLKRTDAPPAS
ncbi:MAG: cytochrome c [Geothrix sp.]|uniref:c-type cytochrome n=1 Tax=Geothrix sp. TaxID=1962974 RepID=UPI00184B8660|nr:cytochrome c [Geothrix sp.]NWJ41994.1 cytochrome c [Geothrix sp.]WIL20034.1 MAG: cytochrome c [Geothrix sp.]